MLLSAVLDANAYINMEGRDHPQESLAELSKMSHEARLKLYVTEELIQELIRDPDIERQQRQISHTAKFPVVPTSDRNKVDTIASELSGILFPQARSLRQLANRKSDCMQLAYAIEFGADYFVTEDQDILRREDIINDLYSIYVLSPDFLLKLILEKKVEERSKEFALVPPKLQIRIATEENYKEISTLLIDVEKDYPDIQKWLLKQFKEKSCSIKTITINDAISAVSISKSKGNGVVKLATFYVHKDDNRKGLGHHLLQHEINSWVAEDYRKAIVTIPLYKRSAIRFFADRGFRIDGISPRRYDRCPEVVMSRHIVKRTIRTAEWNEFVHEFLTDYLCCESYSNKDNEFWILSLANEQWSYPIHGLRLKLKSYFDEHGARISLENHETKDIFEVWDAYKLETELFPLLLSWSGRTAAVIPIKEKWAERLFEYLPYQTKLVESIERVRLRADNVYYRDATSHGKIERGTHILFYVTEPEKGIVSIARVTGIEEGPALQMFDKYEQLGVLSRDDVVEASSKPDSHIQAIRFDYLESLPKPVSLKELKKLVPNINLVTAFSIPFEKYLKIRLLGGI